MLLVPLIHILKWIFPFSYLLSSVTHHYNSRRFMIYARYCLHYLTIKTQVNFVLSFLWFLVKTGKIKKQSVNMKSEYEKLRKKEWKIFWSSIIICRILGNYFCSYDQLLYCYDQYINESWKFFWIIQIFCKL